MDGSPVYNFMLYKYYVPIKTKTSAYIIISHGDPAVYEKNITLHSKKKGLYFSF